MSHGTFIAHYTRKGLAALDFPNTGTPAGRRIDPSVRNWHRLTVSALKHSLDGKRPKELPPLDLSEGTEFQQQVWAAMRKIRLSETKSYGAIAEAVGNPKAVRAVGGACGANPIPVLIPCHRVLAAQGKLGGFSGGLDWKRKLLAIEGVEFR